MKITSRGRYAVLAMVDIAKHGESSPCSLAHISIRQNISLSYLEQIFNDLKKAELVRSQRGPGGGYKLSKNSSDIRILEIFDAIDEADDSESIFNKLGEIFESYKIPDRYLRALIADVQKDQVTVLTENYD